MTPSGNHPKEGTGPRPGLLGVASIILALALVATAAVLITLGFAFLQDWRALLVFLILPLICVGVIIVAALKP